jgi:iron(III) transport system permease protein
LHYQVAFKNPLIATALFNTLVLACSVATITCVLAFLVAYHVIMMKSRTSRMLDAISILPIGVPAIILSLGFLWAFLWLPFGVYGTIWAMMIALTAAAVPTAIRTLDAALRQLGGELEFSGQLLGAGVFRRMVQITLPMCRSALASVWLLAFMITAIQVSIPIVLRTPGQELLSVAVWSLVVDSGDIGQASVAALLQAIVCGLVVVIVRFVSERLPGS